MNSRGMVWTALGALFIFGALMAPVVCLAAVVVGLMYIRWCVMRGIIWYQMRDMPKLNKQEQDEALRIADKMNSGRPLAPWEDRWVESRFGGVGKSEPTAPTRKSGPGRRYYTGGDY